jgi:transcriptional regulator with XRE-family HTH domain
MTKLRAIRADRGGPGKRAKPLTIRGLSERTGFSIGHLSDVEQGKYHAGDELVSKLATVYRRPVKSMRRICDDTYREAGRDRE